ncbi:MAG: STAS domain-containing protein [Herpetosiphonaceae bacterium]|nr:STAS domain-containing protein [Herpetosiphonaceae bacterium]
MNIAPKIARHVTDDNTSNFQRIRLFLLIQLCVTVLIFIFISVVGEAHEIRAVTILALANAVLLGITYWLRHSRYAEWVIYLNLSGVALLLALSGPISGKVDGSVWVLFQMPPLVATIVLNTPRATIIVSAITAVIMTTVIGLELGGVIPVELVVPRPSLIVNFGNQLLTLAVVAITVRLLVNRAQRAFSAIQAAQQQLAASLDHERKLAAEQERINQQLVQSLATLQTRDAQLQAEQAQQSRLRSLLSELSTPVIPILDGVVVMPLIGELDQARATELTGTLLNGITAHRAHIVILDVTGLPTIDSLLGKALIQAADAARLLGATPIMAGIRPDVAQTLTSLGISFTELVTVSNLQTGVQYALAHPRR